MRRCLMAMSTTTRKVTGTALGPMLILAIEQHADQPLVHAPAAHQVLPTGLRVLAGLTRWRPVRRWFVSSLERDLPGGWANFCCRKRYIDEVGTAAFADGVETVVNLGAGMDDRTVRLPEFANRTVYEVDLPANSERKRMVLCRATGGVPPAGLRLVAVDFDHDDLGARLAEHGYRPDTATLFIWEAVTQYLTEDGVRKTFEFLAAAAPGSQLAVTYVARDFLDATNTYGAPRAYDRWVAKQRLWRFGWLPDEVGDFFAAYGWRVIEQAGSTLYTQRYLRPSGRELAASDLERCVWAEKI